MPNFTRILERVAPLIPERTKASATTITIALLLMLAPVVRAGKDQEGSESSDLDTVIYLCSEEVTNELLNTPISDFAACVESAAELTPGSIRETAEALAAELTAASSAEMLNHPHAENIIAAANKAAIEANRVDAQERAARAFQIPGGVQEPNASVIPAAPEFDDPDFNNGKRSEGGGQEQIPNEEKSTSTASVIGIELNQAEQAFRDELSVSVVDKMHFAVHVDLTNPTPEGIAELLASFPEGKLRDTAEALLTSNQGTLNAWTVAGVDGQLIMAFSDNNASLALRAVTEQNGTEKTVETVYRTIQHEKVLTVRVISSTDEAGNIIENEYLVFVNEEFAAWLQEKGVSVQAGTWIAGTGTADGMVRVVVEGRDENGIANTIYFDPAAAPVGYPAQSPDVVSVIATDEPVRPDDFGKSAGSGEVQGPAVTWSLSSPEGINTEALQAGVERNQGWAEIIPGLGASVIYDESSPLRDPMATSDVIAYNINNMGLNPQSAAANGEVSFEQTDAVRVIEYIKGEIKKSILQDNDGFVKAADVTIDESGQIVAVNEIANIPLDVNALNNVQVEVHAMSHYGRDLAAINAALQSANLPESDVTQVFTTDYKAIRFRSGGKTIVRVYISKNFDVWSSQQSYIAIVGLLYGYSDIPTDPDDSALKIKTTNGGLGLFVSQAELDYAGVTDTLIEE